MTPEQKFLIANDYSDLVINLPTGSDPEKWVYVSDILKKYLDEYISEQRKSEIPE